MNQEITANIEASDSADTMDLAIPTTETTEFSLFAANELGTSLTENRMTYQINMEAINNSMIQHIFAGEEDFVIEYDEQRNLVVKFRKQSDGKYQCMVKLEDGNRCSTKGLAKEIKNCIKKKHGNSFKYLKRDN